MNIFQRVLGANPARGLLAIAAKLMQNCAGHVLNRASRADKEKGCHWVAGVSLWHGGSGT